MAKRNNNRVAPPRLDPEAGWTEAEQEAYHAGEACAPEPEAGVAVEIAEEEDLTRRRGGAEGEQTEGRRDGGTEGGTSPCICQHVLGNLATAGGYRSRHIDLQLSAGEQEVVARLRAGLVERHATLVPKGEGRGKHVESANDAVRWLIQQVAGLSIAAAGS